jgi:hypothetical protein
MLLVLLALLLAPATAKAAWHEASTTHFLIYSDEDPAKLRDFADKLERFDRAMRVMHAVPDRPVGAANRVTIFVCPALNRCRSCSETAAETLPVSTLLARKAQSRSRRATPVTRVGPA